MARFDKETGISAIELHQLIADWGHELDMNGGLAIARLLTEDCTYIVGGVPYRGHAPVTKFYTDRGERVRTLQKDGVRTQRHTISNLRVAFQDPSHATVTFIIVNYSAEGNPPVLGLTGPTIVADCRMDCRRETDGEWRISLFDSAPMFVGNDPFLNASVVKG
jgi:SnoaL-like domain